MTEMKEAVDTPFLHYNAVIMAGRRPGKDVLARQAGALHRSLLDIYGEPMLERVIRTLESVHCIDRIFVSIDEPQLLYRFQGLKARIEAGAIEIVPNKLSVSLTIYDFLESLDDEQPVFVTTSDHALLTHQMVNHFLRKAEQSGADLAFGVVEKSLLRERFPESKRTFIPFRGEAISGANLFSFQNARSRRVAEFWIRAEKHRKHPLRMAHTFGLRRMLQFLLRRYDVESAMNEISRMVGATVKVIQMPFAEAGIDVDKMSDLVQVRKILKESNGRFSVTM